jgi:hypothetical protein
MALTLRALTGMSHEARGRAGLGEAIHGRRKSRAHH